MAAKQFGFITTVYAHGLSVTTHHAPIAVRCALCCDTAGVAGCCGCGCGCLGLGPAGPERPPAGRAGMMAGATTAGKGLPWEEARDHHGCDVPSPLDLRRHCPPAPPGLRPIELAALEALCPGKHTELAIT
eukprot:COSAG01_NODE_45081_length_412_cov_9.667732_1_plen_130_part_01